MNFSEGLGGLKNSFYLCLVERDKPQRLEYTEDHSYIFGAPSDPKRTCLI